VDGEILERVKALERAAARRPNDVTQQGMTNAEFTEKLREQQDAMFARNRERAAVEQDRMAAEEKRMRPAVEKRRLEVMALSKRVAEARANWVRLRDELAELERLPL
jgi:hypothetical protein